MEGFVGVNLERIIDVLRRKWWIIVLAAIIFSGVSFSYTHYFITPMYRTNVSIYVNNSITGPDPNTITAGDLAASSRLVNTYVAIVSSNTVLEQVSESLDYKYSAAQIRSMMSSSAVEGTEIFQVNIVNKDPEVAAMIANTIADIAPGEIRNFLTGSSVKIIDHAVIPARPYAPNVSRNAFLGFLAGLLSSILLFALIETFDTRIKAEEDLEGLSDVPILGVVPDFTQNQTTTEYGYGYKLSRSQSGGSQ